MGFLAVRAVVNVDIWCLFLFYPDTAGTGGDRLLSLSPSVSLSTLHPYAQEQLLLTAGNQDQWNHRGQWSLEREGRKGCRAALLKHESAVGVTHSCRCSPRGPVTVPFIQQACLGEHHPHHHPGRVRTSLGGSDTTFSSGSWGQNIQGNLENPKLDHNHLPHSASGGQGKVEG